MLSKTWNEKRRGGHRVRGVNSATTAPGACRQGQDKPGAHDSQIHSHRTIIDVKHPGATPKNRRIPLACTRTAWILVLLTLGLIRQTGLSQTPATREQARQQLDAAAAVLQRMPHDANAIAAFGRTSFELAEFATNAVERAALAEAALTPLRGLVERQPQFAAGHHYLAMNLGQLARTRTLSALRLVGEMERAFLAAARLDPGLDHAGPDRYLGKLYRDAPPWPASIGSRTKSRRHFELSVRRAPDFPENPLCLIEALLQWGEAKAASTAAKLYAERVVSARARWVGPEWTHDWKDWEARWQRIERRLREKEKQSQPAPP